MSPDGITIYQHGSDYKRDKGGELKQDEFRWQVTFRTSNLTDIYVNEARRPSDRTGRFIEIRFRLVGVPDSHDATERRPGGPQGTEIRNDDDAGTRDINPSSFPLACLFRNAVQAALMEIKLTLRRTEAYKFHSNQKVWSPLKWHWPSILVLLTSKTDMWSALPIRNGSYTIVGPEWKLMHPISVIETQNNLSLDEIIDRHLPVSHRLSPFTRLKGRILS